MNCFHGNPHNIVRGARWLPVIISAICVAGCGVEPTPPVTITADQRTSIQQHVSSLGGRVTSNEIEALYMTLRNTHIQIRDTGGVVEAAGRTRQDIQDFGRANEAIAKAFLADSEFAGFQQWLRTALSPSGATTVRAEYRNLQLNVSRAPLRVVFSPRSVSVSQ